MRHGRTLSCLLLVLAGCSAETPTPPEGAGSGGGGAGGSAGSATGGAGSAGMTTGGTGNVAGTATTGGSAGSPGAGGTAGAGFGGWAGDLAGGGGIGAIAGGGSGNTGGTQAGSSGTAGSAGATGGAGTNAGGGAGLGGTSGGGQGGATAGTAGTGGDGDATPSSGCGEGGRPNSPLTAVEAIITYPEGYDGDTPYPMIFGFHGAGRTNQQFREVDARTANGELEDTYVMVYLKSQGNDWTGALTSNYTRFDAAYTELTTKYCIDTSRVLAMGHSSGAQFISNLVCRPEPRLRGVAPVASSPYGQTCPGIPALIIHGANDSERGNDGAQYVQQYVSRAGCSDDTEPYQVAGCTSSGTQVDPGCNAYVGCGENPVIWCSHNDPNYSGTNHGWPCFANDAIFDFFATLQ